MQTEYIVQEKNGGEKSIMANTPAEALSIFLKRGKYGLGSGWLLSRGADGWIVASNKSMKTLERTYHKLREKNWTRGMR